MRKISRKLSSIESVHSSASTDSDLSPIKPLDGSPHKRSSVLGQSELGNARIIQSKLVYVINLPESVANEETLKRKEYFGQYGIIVKCVVNKNSQHIAYQAYLTYSTDEEAAVCIKACNKFVLDGNELTLTFGTTKYCNYFLRNNPCPKTECLYLHEFAIQNNVVLREAMPHTKHLQPCNSLFDGIKVVINPPAGNMKLPIAKIIRDRACSEQIFESPGRSATNKNTFGRTGLFVSVNIGNSPFSTVNSATLQSNTSRFGFAVDGDETDVPGNYKALRKFSSPKDEIAEIPLPMYNDLHTLFFEEKWVNDVLEFKLGQEKVLVISKT
ncbi:hypothetical protein SteCoe_32514 [Stentor coeruleus]|uniref:RRM domain-containing protein n=1 Tax=Stentor coeruleus TaxID=5963 RepID=A0A1R2AZ06_9CILI|nr:hypothetical protein SteCoe_32514 [Stentor coeruleus]